MRVYDRPLSATEIDGQYVNGIEIAHWKLDETVAGPVVDTHGVNSGANQGAVIGQPGMVGTAYEFNGTSNYVSVPCMNPPELTLSAWLYRSGIDSTHADAIWGGWEWNSNVQLQEGYDVRFAPDSSALEFDLVTQNSNGVRNWNVCYTAGVSLNQWHYVAVTYDAASGVQTIYLDGVAAQTVYQPAGNTIVPVTGYPFAMYLGYSTTNNGYFDGLIDDVKVFDRPLSAVEIAQQYPTFFPPVVTGVRVASSAGAATSSTRWAEWAMRFPTAPTNCAPCRAVI